MGICISRPPALCLAPDPGPQFVFTGPGPQFVFTGPGPKFVFPGPGPQFVFTGPGPNFYYPALVSPKPELADTNLVPPQSVFTGPGLRFLLRCSEFAFTFLSIVVAVAAVLLAIVVIS